MDPELRRYILEKALLTPASKLVDDLGFVSELCSDIYELETRHHRREQPGSLELLEEEFRRSLMCKHENVTNYVRNGVIVYQCKDCHAIVDGPKQPRAKRTANTTKDVALNTDTTEEKPGVEEEKA